MKGAEPLVQNGNVTDIGSAATPPADVSSAEVRPAAPPTDVSSAEARPAATPPAAAPPVAAPPTPPTDSAVTSSGLLSASLGVGAGALLSKVLGVLRTALTAYYFGAGVSKDAFVIASTIPTLIVNNVGTALATVSVPILMRAKVSDSQESAMRQAEGIWSMLCLATLGLVIAGEIAAVPITRLLAPGLQGDALQMTVALFRLMLPMSFGLGIGLFRGLLNSCGQFTWPAMGEPLQNLIIIVAIVALVPAWQIYGLAGASLLGTAAYFLMLVLLTARLGFRFSGSSSFFGLARLRADWRHMSGLFTVVGLTLVATSLGAINIIIDRGWATGVGVGAASALDYAMLVLALPMTLVGTTLNTVSLPAMAAYSARADWDALVSHLRHMLLLSAYLLLPLTGLCLLVAGDLITLLLGYGAFSRNDQQLTSSVLAMCLLSLPALAWGDLLTRMYLANNRYYTPVAVVIGGALVNVVLVAWLVGPLGAPGIALATSISTWLWAVVLTVLPGPDRKLSVVTKPFVLDCCRILAAAAVAVGVTAGGYRMFVAPAVTRWAVLGQVMVVGLFCLGVYLLASRLLQIPERRFVYALAARVLGRRSS